MKLSTILFLILLIVAGIMALLYFMNQKMMQRQLESEKIMAQYTQTATILVIDKKRFKIKDAPLPKELYEQTPFYLKAFLKVGVVKAKIGPRIMNLVADGAVYNSLPEKAECKVKISGIYINEIIKGAVLSEKDLKKRTKANEKARKKAEKEAAKNAKA